MKISLSGAVDTYDVETICLLFYMNEKFNTDNGRELSVTFDGNIASADFLREDGEHFFGRAEAGSLYDGPRFAVKRAVYDALSTATGKVFPWGLLTGIKPGVFYEKVKNAIPDSWEEYLVKHLGVSEKKIDVCRILAEHRKETLCVDFEKTASLYISIPFCNGRCKYCSFVSASTEKEGGILPLYLKTLKAELRERAEEVAASGKKISCIYIGGGTPTILSPDQLEYLLSAVNEYFDLSSLIEYTVEAGRPDTFSLDKLQVLRDHGVDRISVNPQTTDDSVLERIGRRHTVADFYSAYEIARKVGFSVNVDLIAALPGDTFKGFEKSLTDVLALSPENITVHTLSIKKSSDYAESCPELIAAGEMVDLGHSLCREQGYLPYYMYRQKNAVGGLENTGYSLKGKSCLYNVFMMDDLQTVFGAGANAMTKFVEPNGRITRRSNTKYAYNYVKGL